MRTRASLLAALLLALPAFAAARITVTTHGTLQEALREIAAKGHLNLVVTEPLDQPAEVYLQDLPADEALKSVAKAYRLSVSQDGSVFTVAKLPPAAPAVAPAPTPKAEEPDEAEPEEAEEPAQAQPEAPVSPSPAPAAMPAPPVPPPPPAAPKIHELAAAGVGHVEKGETVDSAVIYGGPLTIDGEVSGDAVDYGNTLEVNGEVHGNAIAFGGDVHLNKGAHVHGDARAFGGTVYRDSGARLDGTQQSIGGPDLGGLIAGGLPGGLEHGSRMHHAARAAGSHLSGFLLQFAVLFGVGFLCMIFAPSRMRQIEAELRRDPVKCGLTGIAGGLVLFVLLLASAFLSLVVIGIPFFIFLVVMAGLGLMMGMSAFASEIGLRLPFLRGRKTQAIVLAAGLVILLLVGLIPVMGPLTLTVVGLLSLGAVIRTRFGARPQGIPEPLDHVAA